MTRCQFCADNATEIVTSPKDDRDIPVCEVHAIAFFGDDWKACPECGDVATFAFLCKCGEYIYLCNDCARTRTIAELNKQRPGR